MKYEILDNFINTNMNSMAVKVSLSLLFFFNKLEKLLYV